MNSFMIENRLQQPGHATAAGGLHVMFMHTPNIWVLVCLGLSVMPHENTLQKSL